MGYMHHYGAEHVQINTDVLNTHYVLSAGHCQALGTGQ